VTDHLIMLRSMDLIYRDNMLEPVALLSHLAGLVPRVKLGTSVLILPYRNPVVLAKMLATVDQLSGGRVIVGVGGGWMTEEFAALSTSYPERGKVSDECLRVMRTMWTQETVSFDGHYTSFQDMQVSPLPVQKHLPIWVGGVSARAVAPLSLVMAGTQPVSRRKRSPRASNISKSCGQSTGDPANL
jgi:probable F420-dependent oxidoreductase